MLAAPNAFAANPGARGIKAIAFDAFAIFDPRPIFKKVEELFPNNAKQLVEVWQSKQFSYQWLRASANMYKNFWDVTEDALEFALKKCEPGYTGEQKDLIMTGYETMDVWPEVIPALRAIKKMEMVVCLLSNMTLKMLCGGIQNSNLEYLFDRVISTDERQTYKPSREAYQMPLERLKLKKQEILFVPFAGWDLAGAKWFGYSSFWVNRLNSSIEKLDAEPDGVGSNLNDLVEFINNTREGHSKINC